MGKRKELNAPCEFRLGNSLIVEPQTRWLGYFKERYLSDGTPIYGPTRVGWIDIMTPRIGEDETLIEYVRRIRVDVLSGLATLSQLCQADRRLRDVSVFGGVSHLSKLAPKYGFEVFPIQDEGRKLSFTGESRAIVSYALRDNKLWNILSQNIPYAMEAWISRRQLISLYGSH